MSVVQVLLGVVAGVVYSLVGWLKNMRAIEQDILVDERELANAIKAHKLDEKTANMLAECIFTLLWEKRYLLKAAFNREEFIITIIQGLLIGLLFGALNIPLDAATSIVAQIGVLSLLRKAIKIFR